MTAHTSSFAATWQRAVDAYGSHTFLVFHSDDETITRWTYREFNDVVGRLMATLVERGVQAGDAVHLMLRNSPVFIATWLAVARLGAWMVPADPGASARDIALQVRRVKPTLAVVGATRIEVYREGSAETNPSILIVREDATDLDSGSELMRSEPLALTHSVEPLDRLAVMFTSGTTTEPKGVELTQACYASVARVMSNLMDLQATHRWFVTLPMFHANAQYYCFAPAIERGASVALTASFSASRWVEQARTLEVTHASLFAAPIRMILARTPSDSRPLELQHVWFAQNLGREHYRAFGTLVGVPPRQLYGMTETVSIIAFDRSPQPVHDLIGPPLPDRKVRIIDPVTGFAQEPGLPGELQVWGRRGWDIFPGYLDASGINDKAFVSETDQTTPDQDGAWFRTGDLVKVTDDGHSLRFVGRVDDVIKVSGENVSLSEIEAALAQAPGVLEVAVVTEPDPIRDQVPIAYVVAKDRSNPPSEDSLRDWSELNLSPAARPRGWNFINELPRTSVGKVKRFRVANSSHHRRTVP